MIKANAHKYSVSAMCRVLQVNRSTYYYEAATKKDESELTADIQEIFRKSRNHYGTRKIKKELVDCGKQVSRRRIGRIMKQEGLISSYTTAQFKPQKDRCNESKVANVLNRQFQNQPYRNVVVSDLTYVRVGNHWNYICILIDLFNREIVGYSAGEHKTAELVKQAFRKVEGNLSEIHIFHTDRGNEFKNETIEELLETFHIERSLSHKGCPYDNAVAEATFKVIKTDFVWNETFHTLEELKIKLWDYVNWYNHHRIHSSLGYQTPVQYRENNLKNLSEKVLTIQRLKIMAMFQVLKNSDNSFVLYISLLIRFFIRQLQPIIWITKGCWFIFQNVRTIRSPLFLHLWKPIFVHIKPMRQNSRKISIFSGLFLNYSEEKQGGNSMIKRSTLLTYFIIVFSNSFTLTLSLTIPSPASICTASTIP